MKKSRRYIVKKKRNLKKSWRSLSSEDKGDLVKFLQIVLIILAVGVGIYFLGISSLTHLSDFWSIFTGEKISQQGDTTAPPPPTFSPKDPYTRSKKVDLQGYAEPGAEVTLFVNGEEKGKTVAEAGGTFNFSQVTLLKEGKNTLTATAKDKAGNKSQKSAELVVTLDTKPPKLEVSKPKDGQEVTENTIRVEGEVEEGTTVKVNSIQAQVLANGIFRATITASEPGEVKITITAKDRAGNEEKAELSVTYQPEEEE